ncbi:MAG: molybdenum cofactor guanylyltransferase MobA [Ancalomicrobiaceae bacterium]|nr:molybdenum cofactor guanylyltransferase MobA [Ancalomicrobiaceae bacterium]
MSGPLGPAAILGVILAGGQSLRLGGGDKGLRLLAGRTLIDHVAERLKPQVWRLILNANGDPARFAGLPFPVVADTLPDQPGPLAGLLAGLRYAATATPAVSHVLTAAADTPFLPTDLAERFAAALDRTGAEIALATSASGVHPVVALVPVGVADRLEADLVSGAARRVLGWLRQSAVAEVAFSGEPDPFFNINTPEDLAEAERYAAARIG